MIPIVDLEAASRAGWRPVALADALLAGGARLLQLRAKAASGAEFLTIAGDIARRAHAVGAALVVNDRADIAQLSDADGVHVGQDDLAPAEVRRIVGDQAIVGLSTHTPPQLDRAIAEPITYVAIGPVFGTATKDTGYNAVGLDAVRAAAARARGAGLPLVAIGGITLESARSVIEAGASSVAVIGDLLRTADPETRVRDFLKSLVV